MVYTKAINLVTGHRILCVCGRCLERIKAYYKAFLVEAIDKSTCIDHPCPKCGRECWPEKKTCWRVWSCWEDNAEEAVVTSLKQYVSEETGELVKYGFMKNQWNETIYFNFNRGRWILFDGSDNPMLSPVDRNISLIVNAEIIYQHIAAERGPKALWWVKKSDYLNVKFKIFSRESYRLIIKDDMIYWEGKNLKELRSEIAILQLKSIDYQLQKLNTTNSQWETSNEQLSNI